MYDASPTRELPRHVYVRQVDAESSEKTGKGSEGGDAHSLLGIERNPSGHAA